MNKHITTILIFSFVFVLNGLYAQPLSGTISGFPMKRGDSPLFGKDIVIHDFQNRDQKNLEICSAFNGWLYAIYSYIEGDFINLSILKSTDDGISWEVVLEGGTGIGGSTATKLDIIACGTSISDLKLFIGVGYYRVFPELGGCLVWRYKAEPFIFEDEILGEYDNVWDFDLSSDYIYSASNSNPYSLAILYSKEGLEDSIIFKSSNNGGLSFNDRKVLATSPHYFHKVALNYGRSPSWNAGRYYAAWEEQIDRTSILGHIYTSHSEPTFNSPFTKPVCLDSLEFSTINKCRNPVIG